MLHVLLLIFIAQPTLQISNGIKCCLLNLIQTDYKPSDCFCFVFYILFIINANDLERDQHQNT